jgi:hypothetical protein
LHLFAGVCIFYLTGEVLLTEDTAFFQTYQQIYRLLCKKVRFLFGDPFLYEDSRILTEDDSRELRSINDEIRAGERAFWAIVQKCRESGKKFSVEVLADHLGLSVFEKRAMLFLLFQRIYQPTERGHLPEQIVQLLDVNDSVVDKLMDLYYFSDESALVKHVLTFSKKGLLRAHERHYQISPKIVRQMTLLLRGEIIRQTASQVLVDIEANKSNGRKPNDKAMNGGIDLNQINVKRNGKTVNVKFDPAQLNELVQGGFKGFTPVIINITPIQSPFQLLGINPVKEVASLAKA